MSFLVVVSYDVLTRSAAGRRRLRRVANVCEDFGQRVQSSVFECLVDPEQWTRFRGRLLAEYNSETDSLRFYYLGKSWKGRKEHHGAKSTADMDDPLIV